VRYHVTLEPGSPTIVVDVEDLPSGALNVRVDGRRAEVDVVTVGAQQLSVRVDGQVVDLTTEGSLPDLQVGTGKERVSVRVESERQRAADAAKKETREESVKVIFSPMPGRVVKVFVQKGDIVATGQPLLVIEAMKMENEILAKGAGTVAEVHAVTGAAVESHARLVTLA
jgi:biotin carboxyl carrier protein